MSARLLFAEILLESGELAAAEEQYKRALDLNADRSLVILPLAESLLLQSKAQEIVKTINIGPFPDKINTYIYVYRAKAYFILQNLTEAQLNFESALRLSPNESNALLGLASIAIENNEVTKAKGYIEQAKKSQPEASYTWFFEGEMYRRYLEKDKALAAYQQAILLDAENYDAIRSRASIYLDNNQLPLAKADIERVLLHSPTDTIALLLKAIYLAKLNQNEEVNTIISDINYQFSLIEPIYLEQFAPLLLLSGMSQYMEGNYQGAAENLQAYLAKMPNSIEARSVLAEVAVIREQHDLIVKVLSPIATSQLRERQAYLLLNALLKIGAYAEGLEVVNSLPDNLLALNKIKLMNAILLIKSGRTRDALSLLDQQIGQQLPRTQLILGYAYIQLAFYDDALAIVQQLQTKEQLSIIELNYIATVYLSIQDYEQAEIYYRQALVLDANDEIVNLNLSQLLIKLKQYQEADNILARILSKSPENKKALPIYAELLEKQGRYQESIERYELLDSLTREQLTYKYKLANLYLHEKQISKAIDIAQQINKIEPLSATAMIIKAKAQLLDNQLTAAQRTLRIAVGLFTQDSDRLTEIIKLQIKAQDWQYVESSIDLLVGLTGETTEVVVLNALKEQQQGNYTAALSRLKKIKAKDADINRMISKLYLQKSELNNALGYAQKAYQQHDSVVNHISLVEIYWRLEQREKAFSQFEQWLEKEPDDWQGRRMYANFLAQDEKVSRAVTQYEQVLLTAEKDVFSLNNLALLLLKQEKPEDALVMATKVHGLAPLDARVNDTYGWVLVKNKFYDKGLEYLRESYSRDINNAQTLHHIGITLHLLGRKAESLESLDNALALAQSVSLQEEIKRTIAQVSQ